MHHKHSWRGQPSVQLKRAIDMIGNDIHCPWCGGSVAQQSLALDSQIDSTAPMTTSKNVVVLHQSGPAELKGTLEIVGSKDPEHRSQAWLCRCGASANKPFCDGSHQTCGFEDAGDVAKSGGEPSGDDEPLKVSFMENGPALLSGPLTIVSADGTPMFHAKKAALCRCGASSTKPFCDGAHKAAGFVAP